MKRALSCEGICIEEGGSLAEGREGRPEGWWTDLRTRCSPSTARVKVIEISTTPSRPSTLLQPPNHFSIGLFLDDSLTEFVKNFLVKEKSFPIKVKGKVQRRVLFSRKDYENLISLHIFGKNIYKGNMPGKWKHSRLEWSCTCVRSREVFRRYGN